MTNAAAVLLLAVALAGCNRQRTHSPPAATGVNAAQEGTWVAIPPDLDAEQVKRVQRALADRGFPVEASGSYDDQTRTAMRDFQRSRGLPTTGNLNPDTAAALGLEPEEVMPERGPAGAAPPPSPEPHPAPGPAPVDPRY